MVTLTLGVELLKLIFIIREEVTLTEVGIENRIEVEFSGSTLKPISKIINDMIEVERISVTSYGSLAKQTANPTAQVLFKRLSSVGKRHMEILNNIQTVLTETGEITRSLDLSTKIKEPQNIEFNKYTTDVERTYYSMRNYLEFEAGLMEIYEEVTQMVEDKRAQSLFQVLALDEMSHHKELLVIIEMFQRIFKDTFSNT